MFVPIKVFIKSSMIKSNLHILNLIHIYAHIYIYIYIYIYVCVCVCV